MRVRILEAFAFAVYVASIFAANWLITNVGTERIGGVHTIPVGFGLEAPSGVIAVGVALTSRDIVHELNGRRFTILAILIGAALSSVLNPAIALASGVAFLMSELVDLLVYSKMRATSVALASVLSNTAGALLDSAVFLWLAFGSAAVATFAVPQVIGKLEWSTLAIPALLLTRSRVLSGYERPHMAEGV
jgi:uncharacterized PurR-regulated membrane protein YhhQ (DUF165 family)